MREFSASNMDIWRIRADNEAAEGQQLKRLMLKPTSVTLDEATRLLPSGGYTTFRTFGKFGILRLEDHFIRLEETSRLSGHPLRLDRARITAALHQAFALYPAEEMRVRITLDLEQKPGDLYLLVEKLQMPGEEDYRNGICVLTRAMHRQNPKAKLTRFIETASAIREVMPEGINEVVMVAENGTLLEGLSSNFFALSEGIVWTAEEGVLSGITRSMVLEVIRKKKIPLRLEGWPVAEIAGLDEAFLTSASRAVLPVVAIDDQKIGNGRPGPVTLRLLEEYQRRVAQALDQV